jgi:hypothetical protein
MSPKLRSKARSIAAEINATNAPTCVWLLDRGTDLGHGSEYPPTIPYAKHVGLYTAPCAHSEIVEDVDHVFDQLAHNPGPGYAKFGRRRSA